KTPGSTAVLGIWRNGKEFERKVVLGERHTGQSRSSAFSGEQNEMSLGLTVRPISEEERRELSLPKDEGLLIVGITSGKPAAEADLRNGDVILKANLKPVNSAEALARIVKEEGIKRGSIMLQIQRRGNTYFRTVLLSR
ncbi:MAG: PDZ domain-containing protein, partial [Desulfovibrio sp.]|nr:PDZ domain-containing protein [Desulfovibrio sp.]